MAVVWSQQQSGKQNNYKIYMLPTMQVASYESQATEIKEINELR
jgi:hypothetical protein